jgi:hypothetical protein
LEAVFEMPNKKQEPRTRQKELNPTNSVDIAQFSRNCHPKTLVSFCCMYPWIVRRHHQLPFTSRATPNNNLGENISDLVGAVNISSFGMACHSINNLEFMGIPNER